MNKEWLNRQIYVLKRKIKMCESRLKLFTYDKETSNSILEEIDDYKGLIAILGGQIPVIKLHEYGGDYKCPVCGCVVNKYAKHCHFCGQRFVISSES